MNIANIALLGTSNSGKTNFILETIKDINSFSPNVSVRQVVSEQTVDIEALSEYQYLLNVYGKEWMFTLCDYAGKLLKLHQDDGDDLKTHLFSADIWIILLDGTYWASGEESAEKVIRKIKRGSVRTLMPYISEYVEKRNGTMPEMLFVVTKAKELIGKPAVGHIKRTVMNAFEGLFTEESSPMILLCETSNTKAAGMAVLSLLYLRYAKEVSDHILVLEKRNEQIQAEIKEIYSLIYEIQNQRILGKLPANKRKVECFRRQISSMDDEAVNNANKLVQYKNDAGLEYLGICVQCLIEHYQQLLINGFEKINCPYDKSSLTIEKSRIWGRAVSVFNLCMLCFVYVLKGTDILSKENGWILAAGYALWFIFSVIIAVVLDKRRDRRHIINKMKSDPIYFIHTKAKEKK